MSPHLSQSHEFPNNGEVGPIGVDVAPLLKEVVDGLHRVNHEHVVAEPVKEHQVT